MAPTVISLEVTTDHAVPVEPSLGGSVSVLNVSGDTLYYADNPQVSASNNQGTLTAGQSATFSPPQWLKSAGLSTVTVTVNDGATSSSGIGIPAVALTGTPTSGQVPTATGGAAATWQTPPAGGSGGWPATFTTVTTTGTSTASTTELANATGGAISRTLPASPAVGVLVGVKKTDATANAVTVLPGGGGTIDGDANAVISVQDYGALFQHTGSNVWIVVSVMAADGQLYYQTLQVGGANKTQRGHLNLIAGTNVTITEADNSGADSSDVTINSTGGGSGNSFPSWIDISNPPGGSGIPTTASGADPTASIQAAMNYFNTNNINGRIYWSSPIGTIAGAATSGSGTGLGSGGTYNGQILVPARVFTVGGISITIMGLCPMPNNYYGGTGYLQSSGGSELISSLATAGARVFDAIPGDAPLGVPMTNINLTFENCCVRAPSNPACSGVDGNNLKGLKFQGSCRVDTALPLGVLTGAGFGVRFPPTQNGGIADIVGDLEVLGYPTGVIAREHFRADKLVLGANAVGLAPDGLVAMKHSMSIGQLNLQGNSDGIKPLGTAGSQIKIGQLDIGDVSSPYAISTIVNDPNNVLFGEAQVYPWDSQALKGFHVVGATNFRFSPRNGLNDWPCDSFARIANTTGNNPGTTSDSHHPWIPAHLFGGYQSLITDLSTTGGVLKSTNASQWVTALVLYRSSRASRSRMVRYTFTTAAGTYSLQGFMGWCISGTNGTNANTLNWGTGSGGSGSLTLGNRIAGTSTTLAATATGKTTTSTQYTVDVLISNPPGGPYVVSLILNGTIVPLTISGGAGSLVTVGGVANGGYQLSATEASQVSDTDQTHTQDGIGMFQDTSSSFSYFAVMPV